MTCPNGLTYIARCLAGKTPSRGRWITSSEKVTSKAKSERHGSYSVRTITFKSLTLDYMEAQVKSYTTPVDVITNFELPAMEYVEKTNTLWIVDIVNHKAVISSAHVTSKSYADSLKKLLREYSVADSVIEKRLSDSYWKYMYNEHIQESDFFIPDE